jgi:hypothetical protein
LEKLFLQKALLQLTGLLCCSGLLVSFLYFRTVTKIDITQVTRSTGFQNSALQYVGLMAYRYGR